MKTPKSAASRPAPGQPKPAATRSPGLRQGAETSVRPPLRLPPLTICADDYGIAPGVSEGIRSLIAAGKIQATGAMTLMPHWPDAAKALKPLGGKAMIGLHLTLTDQIPLGPMPVLAPAGRLPSVGDLLKRSFARRLDLNEVAAETGRQLDAFITAFGRAPDFIDGHQHVHVLPGIRTVVLDLFGSRLDPSRCWLRDCWDRLPALLVRPSPAKALLIAALSAGLGRDAAARGILTNQGFSGFYQPGRRAFADLLPVMLKSAGPAHLLMVHPGHVDADLCAVDSLTTPREAEWAALQG